MIMLHDNHDNLNNNDYNWMLSNQNTNKRISQYPGNLINLQIIIHYTRTRIRV